MPTTTEVKIVSDSGSSFKVAGYGVCFGGTDLTGDYFTKDTDFWFGKVTEWPMVLYQHGRDDVLKRTIVGRVTAKRQDDVGLWIEAQISAAKQYADAIRELVKKGVLGWSSGSVPHLVERTKGARGSSEITSWPIVELSLTPTPAEPRTIGVRELKSLAKLDPALNSFMKATSLVEESYEDLQRDLTDAATVALGGYCSVVATYSDHVIVRTQEMGDSDGEYYDIPYTLDSDMEPKLGEPKPVQQAYVDDPGESKRFEETKPYNVRLQGGQYCVVGPDGKNHGCHSTRADALAQQRALYANVPDASKAPLSSDARNNLSGSSFAYIDSSGGRHLPVHDAAHVRAAMSRFTSTHFESPAKKKAAARKIKSRASALGIDVSADSAVAQAAKGAPRMDLEDSAFAFIEPGGTIDEELKTVPRAKRHLGHHLEDGSIDVESLKAALADPDLFAFGALPAAHILRHAQAAGVWGRAIPYDDAHGAQWAKGTAPMLLVREYKAGVLAEAAAADYLANEQLGYDTKDGMRVSPKVQSKIVDEYEAYAAMVTRSHEIEQGIDGAAVVNAWRTQFELLDLEEVA